MTVPAEDPNKWKKPEGEPLFIAINRDNEEMNRAFKKAKATLPQFLKAINTEQFASARNAVKIKILDQKHSAELGEDRYTYLWVWNVREKGNELSASIVELPKGGFNDLVEGQKIVVSHEMIHDWMITIGPKVWGAFTMRVARDRMDMKERAQCDKYTGLSEYSEELP